MNGVPLSLPNSRTVQFGHVWTIDKQASRHLCSRLACELSCFSGPYQKFPELPKSCPLAAAACIANNIKISPTLYKGREIATHISSTRSQNRITPRNVFSTFSSQRFTSIRAKVGEHKKSCKAPQLIFALSRYRIGPLGQRTLSSGPPKPPKKA